MAQRISIFGRFWSKFRYNAEKARGTYDYYRPVDPTMWQFYAGTAILVAVFGLKWIFPWDLPNDFPPTQEQYDAYYAKRRLETTNATPAS